MTNEHTSDKPADENTVPDIEEQRADVAETVAALAAKADVSTRLQNEASYQAEKAKAATQENPQMVAAAIGGLVAAVLVTALLRRRRRRSRRIVVV